FRWELPVGPDVFQGQRHDGSGYEGAKRDGSGAVPLLSFHGRAVAPPGPIRRQSPAAISSGEARPRAVVSSRDPPVSSRSSVVIAATQMKVGNLIMHNGKPHRVTAVVHRTPGNLRGFVQATLVNIESGSKNEHRFSSEDKVERATLDEHSLQFSYKAGDDFHFMN